MSHSCIKFTFFLSLLFPLITQAQRFGGHPPSLKWKQVNSDAARIIFPAGLDSLANDIASLTQFLSVLPNAIDSGKKKKINIVLQNQTLQSNGYVGLAPFRSEFYISPRQNSFELGSIPWHQTLTLHEFRHVQQFNQFNRGLSSFARIFLGEEGQALLNSASVPDWFFEGDAVFFETRYSRQGRGNLPFFFNDFRSLWKEGRNYSFMKLRNGSYKHFVPDHYALGYLLVSYGRTKFGDKFWNRVTEDAAAFKYPIYPFQSAFKKQSGQNYRTFVNEALEYFRKEMLQNEMLQKDSSQNVSGLSAQPAKAEKFVTDYLFPYPCGIDSVLVLKKSYRSIPAWYIIHQGIEKKIAIKDISLDDYYSFKNGKIIYTSYTPSARWAWHDFSNICILDISSGSRTTVSSRSKYFSPDISEDGNSIVAVNQSPSGKNNLHILDAKTGNLIKELPNTQNFVYTYPKFYGNDDYVISSVRTAAGKMGLLKITLNSGAEEWIAGPDMKVYGYPYMENGRIYYTVSFGDIDKIAVTDTETMNTEYADLSDPAYFPSAVSDRLFYSIFTANGYKLQIRNAGDLNWEKLSQGDGEVKHGLFLPDSLFSASQSNLTTSYPSLNLQVSRYRQHFNLFHIHSWRPFFDDPDLSLTLYSQNILNTLQTETYYSYNTNEGSHQIGFNGVYGQLFPYIVGGIQYTMDRNQLNSSNEEVLWNELNINAGLRIPLNLTGGRWYRNLTFSTSFNNQQVYFSGISKNKYENYNVPYWRGSLSFTSNIQQAVQHIFPRLALAASVDTRQSTNKSGSHQTLGGVSVYLPGFHSTHNLVLNLAVQNRDSSGNYRFSDQFPHVRGYSEINFFRMKKFSANYHFPLLYPDWGFANLVYFRRIRPNFFYDQGRISDNFRFNNGEIHYMEFSQRSAGVELFFDTRWWNQLPVSFGFRYSRLLDDDFLGLKPNRFEFIVPVGLF